MKKLYYACGFLMGLPAQKGGWGQVKAFKDRSDPGYLRMAELVEGCIERKPNENTNGWEPTLDQGAAESWVLEARTQYINGL